MVRENKFKDELLKFISVNILNYNEKPLPPFFLKRVNDLSKSYPYEVILQTFKQYKDTLVYWMGQDSKFKNESGRLNYLMAIIQNNISNVYERWKVEQRHNKIDNTVNIDPDLMNVTISKPKNNIKDISEFI